MLNVNKCWWQSSLGVFTTILGLFGLFGNTLSISVLRGREMRNNTFNLLLVVLATIDSFLIVFAIFDYSLIRWVNTRQKVGGIVSNLRYCVLLLSSQNPILKDCWANPAIDFSICKISQKSGCTTRMNKIQNRGCFEHHETIFFHVSWYFNPFWRAFEMDIGEVYAYMFPYFLYPFTNIVLCYSIFLVMVIAFER